MIHAHLVCSAIAECAVVVDGDRAAAWQRTFGGTISITSELPFGATPTVTLELAPPPPPDGARWTMSRAFGAADFLPCAKTTVTATLVGDGGAIWRGSIELPRRGCAHPRVRPRVTCDRAMESSAIGYDEQSPPTDMHPVIVCTVALDRALPLRLFARQGGGPVDVGDFADARASVDEPDDDAAPTPFSSIELAITTAEGAIVWRGHGR